MEPFALQGPAPALVRPTVALQSDLSAVLREGAVLAGEVLESFGGGSLLIGIGRHRVPADSQVDMQAGQRFLFRVEAGEPVVLRVLAGGESAEQALLAALRAAVGHDRPLGTLLAELASALLARAPKEGPDGAAGRLATELGEHLLGGGAGGAELARLVRDGGLAFEAKLLAAALRREGPTGLQGPLGELEGEVLALLARGLAASGTNHGEPGSALEALRAALRSLIGAGPGEATELALARWSAAPGGLSSDELQALVARAFERLLESAGRPARARAMAGLEALELGSLPREVQGRLLRHLLGLAPFPSDPGGADTAAADPAEPARDLKGRLLRALGELPDGPAREAAARALAGIEAEQLLNLARRRSHEPLHWSVPLADGERWATARIQVHRRPPRAGRATWADEKGAQRLSVEVDLTRLGTVRAEVALRPGSLAGRVQVADEGVAARLSAALGELQERLCCGGRSVRLAVHLAPPAELEPAGEDIRYLREHSLLDLRG